MTDQEVLQRVIEIAIDNGWSLQEWGKYKIYNNIEEYPMFIYNHEFAKSLFGEYGYIPEAEYKFQYKKKSGLERTKIFTIASAVSPWQYHLQQMVISEDPIDYLRKWLETTSNK